MGNRILRRAFLLHFPIRVTQRFRDAIWILASAASLVMCGYEKGARCGQAGYNNWQLSEAFQTSGVRMQFPKVLLLLRNSSAADIFIVGYPKSGNTWFQNLVAGIVHGLDPRLGPNALVHDLVPDIDYSKYYRRYATPMFFKSHALPRPEFRRIVYLLRDGRDAMVSYRHYREAVDRVKYDFLKFVSPETELYPCHWPEHVDAWMQNPYGAELLVIKYEDLLRDPVHELQRFCQFAGVSREAEHLTAIAEAASFSNLRDKEVRTGFGRPDHNLPPGKLFFRRGMVGSHKDEMPPEVLQRFLELAGETLRRHGYATDQAGEGNIRWPTIVLALTLSSWHLHFNSLLKNLVLAAL